MLSLLRVPSFVLKAWGSAPGAHQQVSRFRGSPTCLTLAPPLLAARQGFMTAMSPHEP